MLSRSVPRALRQVQSSSIRQASRRFAHDNHGHDAHHAGPVNESFGRSLYIAVAAIPTAYILYTVSRPGTDSSPHPFTRIINAYADLQSTWVERNNLHTKAVERVAHERNLFFNTPQPNHHELRFPEVFSTGSPYNVPAGHTANMDKLIAHYQDKAFADEQAKVEKLKASKE